MTRWYINLIQKLQAFYNYRPDPVIYYPDKVAEDILSAMSLGMANGYDVSELQALYNSIKNL